jgi:hypothetical protein
MSLLKSPFQSLKLDFCLPALLQQVAAQVQEVAESTQGNDGEFSP